MRLCCLIDVVFTFFRCSSQHVFDSLDQRPKRVSTESEPSNKSAMITALKRPRSSSFMPLYFAACPDVSAAWIVRVWIPFSLSL